MKAWNLGVMLLLCGAVAACGDDGGGTGTGGAGGSGQGGDGDGDGDQTTSGTPTTTTTTTGGSPTTTTTTGGPTPTSSGSSTTCAVGEFFGPDAGDCDTCLNAQCCDEATACLDDFNAGGDACVLQDGTGMFNQEGALTIALFECLDANCVEECGGGPTEGVCGTPLSIPDEPEINTCIDDNCCDPFVACFGAEGENLEACNACLEAGGGALCDDYLACVEDAGCFGFGLCDTGISVQEEAVAVCLNENCCEAVTGCFGADGETFDECNDCLTEGSGELCDALIECDTTNECALLTEA